MLEKVTRELIWKIKKCLSRTKKLKIPGALRSIECIGYIPEYSGKYVLSCKFLEKSLKSGLIEFNYLVNFIFRWQKVEKGKNMWKTWLHMFLPFSTFWHKISPF